MRGLSLTEEDLLRFALELRRGLAFAVEGLRVRGLVAVVEDDRGVVGVAGTPLGMAALRLSAAIRQ